MSSAKSRIPDFPVRADYGYCAMKRQAVQRLSEGIMYGVIRFLFWKDYLINGLIVYERSATAARYMESPIQ